MKISRSLFWILAGFLACVFLAACFDPVSAASGPLEAAAPSGPETIASALEPFAVGVRVGDNPAGARSVASPDSARIQSLGIHNFIQLIVTDDEGGLVAFDEVRRKNSGHTTAELWIEQLPSERTYNFLVLMGHWERNYTAEILAADGEYQYTANSPTLLAAGLKSQEVSGSGEIIIYMYPIVVDTKFTGGTPVEPVINAGKPGAVSLLQTNTWSVTWTIKRGATEDNGLKYLLEAQKTMPSHSVETDLTVKSLETLVRKGTESWSGVSLSLNGNVITRSLAGYTDPVFSNIGSSGSVNFKLKYIPFNLTGPEEANPWADYNSISAFTLTGTGSPEWIIRNGLNDAAQNNNTSFTDAWSDTVNGNGAVNFTVAAKTQADGSTLRLTNGKFEGPFDTTSPNISFTTAGYSGSGEVYYAVVTKGYPAPAISAYGLLANNVALGSHNETISIPVAAKNGGSYDVYVILFKSGEASDKLIISTGGSSITFPFGPDA